MIYSLYELFYIFAIYTFLGWLLEVVFAAVSTGGFDNRGFLNGPACPIYRRVSDTLGDNISGGVFSVIKAKDRRVSDLDELKEKYDSLVLRNKILLNRLVRFFHPLIRLLDKESIRGRTPVLSVSKTRALTEEKYYSTIEDLLSEDCVQQMQQYIQHGDTTTYTHCLAVAYYSYRLCRLLRLKVDIQSVARGALLHDMFLYDWHMPARSHRLHGFYHPGIAFANANKYFELNKIEADIIRKHMWPLTVTRIPRCREAAIVCLVDKFCSFSETIGFHYKRQFVFERVNEYKPF